MNFPSPPLSSFSGTVQKHLGRGRRLGYPTANIPAPDNAPEGVFAGITEFDSQKLPSLIFIGSSITFGETNRRCEVYVLDYDGDLYGRELSVEILKKLRDNVKFSSAEELVEQMKQDEIEGRKFIAEFLE